MKTHVLKVALCTFLTLGTITYANTKKTNPNPKKQTIKVALLLDTSGSMSGLINQAKTQLWEIVNELSYAKCEGETPNLQIALYEYGNDGLSAKSGYIRQILRFTDDLDEISERLFSLTTNGGSEYCGQVIQSSLDQLEWGKNKKDLKMIFIAGNEPFTQGKVFYKDAITNAKEKGVTVNTIFCGSYNQGISGKWQDGANLGEGDYMTINHNKHVVHVATPYDQDIIILNKRLNKTYIYYGNRGHTKYVKQTQQDANAKKMAKAIEVKRAISKSSKFYKNSSWDLVDAATDNRVDYTKLKKSQLPKYLRNKSIAEIKTYVTKQRKEREDIQKKIQQLNQKRKVFIAQKQKENSKKNELESVMIKAIKRQAKLKHYTW